MPDLAIKSAKNPALFRRSFGRDMRFDADLPAELTDRLWHDPQSLLAAGQPLQHKPRCEVVRLDYAGRAFVLKRHNWGGPIRTAKKSLRRAPAKQSWLDGRRLTKAGILTPRPRAYVARRFGPFGLCSYLLTDFVAGTTLYRLMRYQRPSPDFVQDLAHQVGEIWQRMDDLKVSHNDLKAENLLVDPTGRVWLIDLEKMRRHKSSGAARRYHAEDVRRLLHPRNWRTMPAAAEVFRQDILRTPAATAATNELGASAHPLLTPLSGETRDHELLTVLIKGRDHARTISACMDSVRDIADEILVADAGSTDGTLDMVRAIGDCRIVEMHGADKAERQNSAIQQARHPWILAIKGNECASADLAKEVQDLLAKNPVQDGFRITRRYYFWGHSVKFGGLRHDSPVRLFRKAAGRYEMHRGQAEVIVPSRKIGHLLSKLLYEPCSNIDQRLKKIRRHARAMAEQARKEGRRASVLGLLGHAPWRFFRSFVLQWGWLDGWVGLHASSLTALSAYLYELMLWECDHTLPPPRPIGCAEGPLPSFESEENDGSDDLLRRRAA